MPLSDLTLVEERIVRLVLAGRSTAQIAADVDAEPRFVEWHVTRAMHKLEKTTALHRRLRRALLERAAADRLRSGNQEAKKEIPGCED